MAKAKPGKKASSSKQSATALQRHIQELTVILGRKELAKRMGVTPSTISRWSNGRATPSAKSSPKLNRIYGQKKPKTEAAKQQISKELIKRQVRKQKAAVTRSGVVRISIQEWLETLEEDTVITNAEEFVPDLIEADLEYQYRKNFTNGRLGYLGEDIDQGGTGLVVLGLTGYQSPKRALYVTDFVMDESEKGLTKIIVWKPTTGHLKIMKLDKPNLTHEQRYSIILKNFMTLQRRDGNPSRMIGYYFTNPDL